MFYDFVNVYELEVKLQFLKGKLHDLTEYGDQVWNIPLDERRLFLSSFRLAERQTREEIQEIERTLSIAKGEEIPRQANVRSISKFHSSKPVKAVKAK